MTRDDFKHWTLAQALRVTTPAIVPSCGAATAAIITICSGR